MLNLEYELPSDGRYVHDDEFADLKSTVTL